MELETVRRGKPKQVGAKRYPGGRIKAAHVRDGTTDHAVAMRAAEAVRLSMLDHRWGTQLGQLVLKGTLTETAMMAGEKWARIVTDYNMLIGAPRLAPSVMDRSPGRRLEADPFDEDAERRAKNTEKAYAKALAELMRLPLGYGTVCALHDLCVKDEHITYDKMLLAKRGLGVLSGHFGLLRD